MNKEHESKLNYHEEENDEDKLNQSHDEDVRSDLNNE